MLEGTTADLTSITKRLEEEAVLFPLLETEGGQTVLLRSCLSSQPGTLTAVWRLLEPVSLALLARESTSFLMQELAPLIPHMISSLVSMEEQIKLIMVTSHCIGLIEVICKKAEDDDLIKLVSWITSNLNLVISTKEASSASSEVVVELIRRAVRGGELESSLRSLIQEVVQEEGEGVPLLVRAAQEPAGHILILWLVRSSGLLPQVWL